MRCACFVVYSWEWFAWLCMAHVHYAMNTFCTFLSNSKAAMPSWETVDMEIETGGCQLLLLGKQLLSVQQAAGNHPMTSHADLYMNVFATPILIQRVRAVLHTWSVGNITQLSPNALWVNVVSRFLILKKCFICCQLCVWDKVNRCSLIDHNSRVKVVLSSSYAVAN